MYHYQITGFALEADTAMQSEPMLLVAPLIFSTAAKSQGLLNNERDSKIVTICEFNFLLEKNKIKKILFC